MKVKIFFFLSFFWIITCSVNVEKELNKLEKKAKVAIVNNDINKIADILEELDELEQIESEKKIQILDKTNHSEELFFLTPSRKVFIFIKNQKINVYYKSMLINTDINKPQDIFSSYNGRYWLFRYKNEANNNVCMNRFYELQNLDNMDKIEFQLKYEYNSECNVVVITDTGNIYEVMNQGIYIRQNNVSVLILAQDKFKKIFKKNVHKFYLVPIPFKGFWIFYGNSGYYDLYYFDEKILKLIYKGAAIPKVFTVTEELFQSYVIPEEYYLVFTGGAGEYTFTGFQLPDETWKSFNVEYKKNYVYIKKQNVFLFLEKENLYILNPETDKTIQLPIKIKNFFVYDDSLILLKDNGLFVRKEPFSNIEKKIFVLKEELLYNIR